MPKPNDSVDLLKTEVTYKGHLFRTGLTVTFPYTRNLVSARSLGLTSAYLRKFQADIEPAGMYLILDELPGSPALPEYEKGTMTLRNPLVIKFNAKDTDRYDEFSWKARLHQAFNRQRGQSLSAAIRTAGYDSIVTVSGRETSEIVKL